MKYVIVFAKPVMPGAAHLLLVKKKRPAWQAGKFNLPGGKIEPGESPEEAAARELREETGVDRDPFAFKVMGSIRGPDFVVYVCYCTFRLSRSHGRTMTDETVHWATVLNAIREERLIPNLRIVIPLCATGATGWEITDEPNSTSVTWRDDEEANLS